MKTKKVALLALYCLAGIIILGIAVSNFWRVRKLLAQERQQVEATNPPAESEGQVPEGEVEAPAPNFNAQPFLPPLASPSVPPQ